MYGFKPQHARGKPVQNFADGGIVHSIKGALGLRPRTSEELLAADAKRMEQNREAAAAIAERNRKAQPAPQQQSAISGYAGMSAMQRREKELGLKDGGRVEPRGFVSGKGTGTSDSIKARLSNGEYVLPADTVKAVGVEALDALRAATHAPVKHEQAKAARGFFVGGTPGGVDEEKLKNSFGDAAAVARDPSVTQVGGLANNGGADASRFAQVPAPIGTQPNRTPEPATPAAPVPAAPAPVAKDPLDGGAAFGVFPQLAGGKRTTYAMDEKLRTGVEATGPSTFVQATPLDKTIIGGGNGQRMNAAQDPRSLTNGATAGNDAAAPSSAATAPPQPDGRSPVGMSVADAQKQGLVGERVGYDPAYDQRLTGAPGQNGAVTRNGNSYSGTNVAGDITVNGQAPGGGAVSAQNMAAADALAGRSQQESMARVSAQQPAGFTPAGMQAPTVRHSGNDWQSRNDLRNAMVSATSIMNDGGKWDKHGKGVVSPERAYAMGLAQTDATLRGAQPGVDEAAMRENAGIQRTGMQEAGATTRTGMTEQGANARESGRDILARDEFNLRKEASGFQTRAAKRLEDLEVSYRSAKTPEERASIAQQLRELQVKDAPARFKVASGGQHIDANGVPYRTPDRIFNEQTGQYSDGAGAAPAPQAMPKPASKAEFDSLPKGARFTDPNGQVRIK